MRNWLAVSVLLVGAGLVAAWLAGSYLIRSVPRGVTLPPGLGA